jgi:hypothetical protein
MNQYYYMKWDDASQSYTIQYGPAFLPENFGITSGFNNIEISDPGLLLDLSWTGMSGYAFWKFIDSIKPICGVNQKIKSQISLDQTHKVVNIQYFLADLDETDIETLDKIFIANVTPIRDQYLKMTDFTQIPDVPISQDARTDFAVFRQQLRDLFNVEDLSTVTWPIIPTSAPNISIPPFPHMPKYNPDQTIFV